jgi:hypothetical protein
MLELLGVMNVLNVVHKNKNSDMNTETNKNRTYTETERTPIVKKTTVSDKLIINSLFNSVIQKIKDKHLS